MNPRSNLWPHQVEALERTDDAIINGRKSGLWSMPTGTGKTRTFCTLMRELDLPALVLVHRGELVTQTINTLADVHPGATVGVVQAERDEWHGVDVCIAMVPSLHAKRLERIPANRFGLVIADEAHHAAADYQSL
jgi:superfamily II DNA or RNA helicase